MRRVMDLCSTIYNSPVFLNFVFQSFRISFRPVSLHGFVISYIHSFFHGRFTPRRAGYLTMKYFWRPRMKTWWRGVNRPWKKSGWRMKQISLEIGQRKSWDGKPPIFIKPLSVKLLIMQWNECGFFWHP